MALKHALILAAAASILTLDASAAPSLGKGRSKTPIEVTSDSLEVLQEENRAIFSGRVVAIQDDVRLKADKMTVFYAKQGEEPAKKKRPAKGDASPAPGAIKKIEATGNVFLSTPEETASGATGIYDVANDMIHLKNSVVLTRGQNVLKGDKLDYNFATGKSVITGGVSAQGADGKSGGRVRALFVPDDKTNKAKP
jgi:lipopolysaccharide export system protein LptA